MQNFFFGGGGGGQTECIIGNMKMANDDYTGMSARKGYLFHASGLKRVGISQVKV